MMSAQPYIGPTRLVLFISTKLILLLLLLYRTMDPRTPKKRRGYRKTRCSEHYTPTVYRICSGVIFVIRRIRACK